MSNYQSQQLFNDVNGIIGFLMPVILLGFIVGMVKPFSGRERIIREGDWVKVTSWYGKDRFGYYARYEERFKPYIGRIGKVISTRTTWDYARRKAGPDQYSVEFPDGERKVFTGREVTFWAYGE